MPLKYVGKLTNVMNTNERLNRDISVLILPLLWPADRHFTAAVSPLLKTDPECHVYNSEAD